jgi:hypothetical protein
LDKWSQVSPFIKIDLNYKNLYKIEENKKEFLNSFYLFVIFQLSSNELNNEIINNNNQLRNELKFTNSIEYPKEFLRIKTSNKTFNTVILL